MSGYFKSKAFVVGLVMFLLGSGPLLFIIIAADLGLWPDPNPNPIGFGILAGLTFWPSLILMAIGVWRVRRGRVA
jgi:hypothetical protein